MQLSNTTGDMPSQDTRQRDIIRVAVPIADCPLFDGQPVGLSPREQKMAIVHMVANRHNVTAADIMGRNREAKIVTARWAAIAAVRYATGDGLSALGRFFNRDHTSILHAFRHIEGRK